MEVERIGPVLRARRNKQPPAKQVTPVTVKKSVSVAAIFTQQSHNVKKVSITPQRAINNPIRVVEDVSDEEAQSFKSRSSPHSPQKAGWKVSKKKSDMHPLAVAFKDTGDEYRRYLYQSTTLKISNTLETLLNNLYESTLQPIFSDANDNHASPIRLSVPAKFEREAHNMYLPISAYQVRLSRTNTNGERVSLMGTLYTRMQDYEEHLAEQKAGIEQLRKDWETIVGEIWKLGVHCLGEIAMESMLFTNKDGHEPSSSPSNATKAESTIFVPEHGMSSQPRTTRSKKRVTFKTPDGEDDLPTTRNSTLDFLHQPSRLRQTPPPAVPVMPEQEIKNLELQISELGKIEIEEYRKAERDYEAHWQRKTAQLLRTFMDD